MKDHDFDTMKCDLLVMGGGGSGAIAAFEASRNQRLKVVLVSRGPVSRSGLTPTGNGGTALPSSPEDMFQFMVNAGEYLNDQSVAWFMVNEIRNSIEELKKLGVPVSPLGPKAACVPGVGTLEVLRRELIRKPNVVLLEDVLVTSLIQTAEGVSAATALDLTTGKFFVIESAATVLATGGVAGELYPYTSNNPFGLPSEASGMGHAMAYLAGAELMDMETGSVRACALRSPVPEHQVLSGFLERSLPEPARRGGGSRSGRIYGTDLFPSVRAEDWSESWKRGMGRFTWTSETRAVGGSGCCRSRAGSAEE